MRIWLDDLRPAPDGWYHCRTAEEAILLLGSGDVTAVSLDHDLGTPLSGYEVACFIERGAFEGTLPRIVCHVHSQNPEGAKRMEAALLKARACWDLNGSS